MVEQVKRGASTASTDASSAMGDAGLNIFNAPSWQRGVIGIGLSIAAWIGIYLWPRASWGFENGPVEWLGTLFFLAASVVFAIAARRHTNRPHKIMAGLLSALFLLSFMEEVSWGQQIFNWSTPPAFESNVQNETNLHNFTFVVDLQRMFTLGILSLTVLVPLVDRFWAWGRGMIHRLGIPVVSLWISGWAVLMLVCDTIYGSGPWDTERSRLGRESLEMLWALAALLVAVTALHQSRTSETENNAAETSLV